MLTATDRKAKFKAIEQRRKRRIENLRQCAELYDSWRQFALALGLDPSFLHALAGPNPRRNIGDDLARSIELTLKLEPGWLDEPH
jgi:hypothetical protein